MRKGQETHRRITDRHDVTFAVKMELNSRTKQTIK